MTEDEKPEPGGTASFGPNAAEVMHFLAELGALDWNRAVQVWEGRAAAQSSGYPRALRRAAGVARRERRDEWQLAREAALVIGRVALGDSTQTHQVLDVVIDVAGVIAISDLLPKHDVELLLQPWTWRGEPVTRPTPTSSALVAAEGRVYGGSADTNEETPTPRRAVAAEAPAASVGPVRASRRKIGGPLLLAAVAIIALITLGTWLVALNRPTTDLAVAGPTGALLATASPPSGVTSPPVSTPSLASPSPVETGPPTPSPGPIVTAAPIDAPTSAPAATRSPTRPPSSTVGPTPTPTPVPKPRCTVISLLDVPTAQAQHDWNDAGFSGSVTFSPDVPPHYKIQWQSLAVGSSVVCTSGITVRNQAP